MTARVLSLLALAFVAGCAHRFRGTIVFRNSSSTRLDWVTPSGFENKPIAGVIPPGAGKYSMMNSMSLPRQISIQWTIAGTSASTNIVLPSLPAFPSGHLVFDYTTSQVWTTRYEPR